MSEKTCSRFNSCYTILLHTMEGFTKMGLSPELLKNIEKAGISVPTDIQAQAIPLALEGADIIGGSATGSGKTLAFSAAIIDKIKPSDEVSALVMCPTRELAEQVSSAISAFAAGKGLNVLAIYGGVSIDGQIRKISQADIVVGTPGRIMDHMQRGTLRFNDIKFLVLDEVDRMFDMGFSKDVEKILKDCNSDRQTMMFSATISNAIDHLAKKYTKDAKEISVQSFVDHSKLSQVYFDVDNKQKFSLLVHLLKKENADMVMVFCSTRRMVDSLTKNLNNIKIEARAIHGGLTQNVRLRVLDRFHSKGVGVLVCTDVAARGLDIKGVSHVYNYDLPSVAEDYVHRIGRTARAGSQGSAISLISNRDYDNLNAILRNEDMKMERLDVPKIETVRFEREERSGNGYGGGDGYRRSDDRRGGGGFNRGGSSGGRDSRGGRDGGRSPSYSRGNHTGSSSGGRPSSGGSSYSRGGSSGGSSYNRGGSSGGSSGSSYNRGGSSGGSSGYSRGGSSGSRDSRGGSSAPSRSYGGAGRSDNRGSSSTGSKSYGGRPSSGGSSGSSYNRGGSSGGSSGSSYNRGGSSGGSGYSRGGSSGSRDSGSRGGSSGSRDSRGGSSGGKDGFRGKKTTRPRR
ncbi:MAG: superfamily II DNA/RNA helicase [Patescibacteria group bacterium]